MKMKDIQHKNTEELAQLLKETRNALREFRFQVGQGKVKNNQNGKIMRRTIARIFTRTNKENHE
ncbi:MAG: 50S ribosomal protein L29 [bacterium]|nr:50S ribosomal protein L29 [bacterium]